MLIASIADVHFRGSDLGAAAAQFNAMRDHFDMYGYPTLLLAAGDIFENPRVGDKKASVGAVEEVAIDCFDGIVNASKQCTGIILVPGNHDISGAGSKDALSSLSRRSGIWVQSACTVRRFGDVAVYSLPWIYGSNKTPIQLINEMLLQESSARVKILLAHIQVIGSEKAKASLCEQKKGSWQITKEELEALPFDRFILGDFHRRQEVVPGRGGFAGALRQLSQSDSGNQAGFEIWDSETGEVKWVELNAAPRYRTLEIHEGALPTPAALEDNIIYRVKVFTPAIDMFARKELEDTGRVKVEWIRPRQERVQRAEVPAGILGDPHGLIQMHCAAMGNEDNCEKLQGVYDEIFADKGPVKCQ